MSKEAATATVTPIAPKPKRARSPSKPRKIFAVVQVLNEAGEQIGEVTSGSPAPYLKTNIAYAYVPAAVAESKVDVFVQVRANRVRAKQVAAPFYKRVKK